jgi:hypothetical protein
LAWRKSSGLEDDVGEEDRAVGEAFESREHANHLPSSPHSVC